MAGSYLIDQPGVYGSKGTTTPDNVPSGRKNSLGLYDSSTSTFWLYGGQGYTTDTAAPGMCVDFS